MTINSREEALAMARLALAYLGVVDAHIDLAIERCIGAEAPGIDLTPFRLLVEACEAEFTSADTEELEPDDSKVSYPEDRCHITFGMVRNARKVLDASPKGGSTSDCPIIRLAPGEYTDWEKRVWRRGVIECATQSDIAAAMQATSHGAGVSE